MSENLTKVCSKCGIEKPLDEFYNRKISKDGKYSSCKKCRCEHGKKYRQEHKEENEQYRREHKKEKAEYDKEYRQEHKEEKRKHDKKYDDNHREQSKKRRQEHREEKAEYDMERRQDRGGKSMYENKDCAAYLGVVIGERLCRHLFKDVEMMPYGFSGYDFICNKNKKIDVKTSSTHLNHGKYPCWKFDINKNTIPDFFILVAFDNRTDLNPIHLWMIPGKELNQKGSRTISLSTIHKWDKFKKDITDAKLCCAELKELNQ
ncbi:hypothetical protein KAU33_09040 [Candidatus Dependentiae bacterium]|nr:hypothetical protein [Candidatus Dependentiae bacterium]